MASDATSTPDHDPLLAKWQQLETRFRDLSDPDLWPPLPEVTEERLANAIADRALCQGAPHGLSIQSRLFIPALAAILLVALAFALWPAAFTVLQVQATVSPGLSRGANPVGDYYISIYAAQHQGYLTLVALEGGLPVVSHALDEGAFLVSPFRPSQYGPLPVPKSASHYLAFITTTDERSRIREVLHPLVNQSLDSVRTAVTQALRKAGHEWVMVTTIAVMPEQFR